MFLITIPAVFLAFFAGFCIILPQFLRLKKFEIYKISRKY